MDAAGPDATGEALASEIDTWRERLDEQIPEVTVLTPRGKRFMENIRAYRSDADHFVAAGDLVRAFECVVWAWAWLEIGADVGELDWTYPEQGWGHHPTPAPDV